MKPRGWLYLVAALMIASSAALIVLAVQGFLTGDPANSSQRVSGPGRATVTLAERGTYTISYEHRMGGNVSGNIPSALSSMQLEVVSPASPAPVHTHAPSGVFATSDGSTEYLAIAEFRVDRPGTYSLASRYADGQSGPRIVLVITPGSPEDAATSALEFLAAGALLLAGFGIGAVTLFLKIAPGLLLRRGLTPVVRGEGRREAVTNACDPVGIWRALDRVYALSQQLPLELHARVAQIRAKILRLLPHVSGFPIGSRDLFVIQRTATEYLPMSVDAYLALPTTYATTAVLHNGKTALQILGDQLDLLEVNVDEIAEAVGRRASERLLVHGGFLAESFGRKSNELGLQPFD
jgi:hypothetical protein